MSLGQAKASLKFGIGCLVWCAIVATIDYHLVKHHESIMKYFIGTLFMAFMGFLITPISLIPLFGGLGSIICYFTLPGQYGDLKRDLRAEEKLPPWEREF